MLADRVRMADRGKKSDEVIIDGPINFNGTSDFVDMNPLIPYDKGLYANENFTLEMDIYPKTTTTGVVYGETGNDLFSSLLIMISQGRLILEFQNNGTYELWHTSFVDYMYINQWSHIKVIRNGNDFILNVKGNTETITWNKGVWNNPPKSDYRNFRLGMKYYGWNQSSYFNGDMKNIIFNKDV